MNDDRKAAIVLTIMLGILTIGWITAWYIYF